MTPHFNQWHIFLVFLSFFLSWFFFQSLVLVMRLNFFSVSCFCYAAAGTQLAFQLHQEHTQVVCSNPNHRVERTPALSFPQWTFFLSFFGPSSLFFFFFVMPADSSSRSFWGLVCYAATQLALQLQQERIQVVRSKKVVRGLPNGTPANFFCFFVCCNKTRKSLLRLPLELKPLGPGSFFFFSDGTFFLMFCRHTASVPSTSGTHTSGVQ